jgi:electron transfer flavoprotein alpha subunit
MTERVLYLGLSGASDLASVARGLSGPGGSVATLSSIPGARPSTPPEVDQLYEITASGFDPGRADHLATAVVAAARTFDASIVLAGPSKLEREAVARAGALLDAPTITGVRSVRLTGEGLEVSRDLLSGNATSVERASGRPILLSLSVLPKSPSMEPKGQAIPKTLALHVELPTYGLRRLSFTKRTTGGVVLESANRIVSVGRGLERKEDLALILGLAQALGAAVGCTRPIAAESGWLSDDHWVGLTGHRVRPTLYVAVGISGAAQHLVGMRDSKVVVAINKDPNAPIFQQADFQVVGDLYAIVPELTRLLAAAATTTS